MPASGLKRGLGLALLTLYGLGTTIGAGIFVLIGEVAGVSGSAAPFSFLVAASLAGLTAYSFARLAVRFPVSAGEAVYVTAGLGSRRLGAVTGLFVALAGLVSSAAILNGFVGYVRPFFELGDLVAIILLGSILTGLAFWGIVESVLVAAFLTLFEIGGLVLVIAVTGENLADIDTIIPAARAEGMLVALPVLSGAILAFYAFIGFEDMVNVAEEVKDVEHNMPRAILLTLVLTGILYVLVAAAAVLTVPPAQLAASDAPLAFLYEFATGKAPIAISAIGVVAVMNGALIQMIMASRVLYGLARQGSLMAVLGKVNARTQTPGNATLLVGVCVVALALWFPIGPLARFTALITLVIFALVNLSLLRLTLRERAADSRFGLHLALPGLGFLASSGFAALQIYEFVWFD